MTLNEEVNEFIDKLDRYIGAHVKGVDTITRGQAIREDLKQALTKLLRKVREGTA